MNLRPKVSRRMVPDRREKSDTKKKLTNKKCVQTSKRRNSNVRKYYEILSLTKICYDVCSVQRKVLTGTEIGLMIRLSTWAIPRHEPS